MKIFSTTLLLTLSLPVNATKLYKRCVTCHGPKAEGRKVMKAPKLAGQHSWYIEEQLKLFRSQERKGGLAKRMYPYAARLTDEEIEELSNFLENL